MSLVREKWNQNFNRRIATEPCLEKNKAWVEGVVTRDFVYDHYSYGNDMYIAKLSVERKSGVMDTVNVMVSYNQLKTISDQDLVGKKIQVAGKLISRRRQIHREALYILAQEVNVEPIELSPNNDIVYLQGDIYRAPVCRDTYHGKHIADVFLRVSKGYDRFAYIPCIAWEGYANYVSSFNAGTRVEVYGRLQSRTLKRRESGDDVEFNEVSIYAIRKMTE